MPDKDFKDIDLLTNTTFLFAHSTIQDIDYESIDKNLKLDWYDYDQRHFFRKPCNQQSDKRVYINKGLSCCNNIGEITIQEYVRDMFNTNSHYSTGGTVAIHALAFAMIMGCKKIYITGVELPFYEKNYRYYDHKFFNHFYSVLRFSGVKNLIKSLGAQLFNLDTKSVFYDDIKLKKCV